MLRNTREYDGQVLVKTEKYLANKDAFDKLERELQVDFEPVDLNDAFVAVEKNHPDNMEETQQNIQARFDLKRGGVVSYGEERSDTI